MSEIQVLELGRDATEIKEQDTIPALSLEEFVATPQGLIVKDDNIPYEVWQAYGGALQQVEGAIHWVIGDWLNYGETHYGEKYAQAIDQTGFGYDMLTKDAWVASKVNFCNRLQKLSWTHHHEVAPLDEDDQQYWLEQAAQGDNPEDPEEQWSVSRLKQEIRQWQQPDTPSLPAGIYRVIYADPPWKYGNTMPDYFTEQGDHYSLMTVREICDLGIEDMAADNAVLFLWATSPILEEAFDVIEAWGFDYKTSFVWDKVKHNMGHYNSVRHELLLICTRGSCQPDVQKLFDSVQTIERTEHSRKPERFREIIDTIYPNGPRVELFARGNLPEPWEGWGYEYD